MVKKLTEEECITILKTIFDKNNLFFKEKETLIKNLDYFFQKSEKETYPVNNSEVNLKNKKFHYYETSDSDYKYGICIKSQEDTIKFEGGLCTIVPAYLIYKLSSSSIEIIKNSKFFDKILPIIYKEKNEFSNLLEVNKKIFDFNKISQNDSLKIYEIHTIIKNEKVKKLRVRFYSDSDQDILNEFEHLFGNDFMNLEWIDIGFSKNNKTTKLKLREISSNQYKLKWDKNNLSKELSDFFEIPDESIFLKCKDETLLLDELFREKSINFFKCKTHSDLISKYSKYIELNKNIIMLKEEEIFNELNKILNSEGYTVEILKLYSKKGFNIISNKGNKSNFFRIKKEGKIVQNILIDHNEYYNKKDNLFEKYFILLPFLILDYRKKRSDVLKNNSNYVISTGQLLKALLDNDIDTIKSWFIDAEIQEIRKDSLQRYGKIAREMANNLKSYNKKIGNNPQQKGQFLEILSLCLLAKIFNIERIGGRSKEDGIFAINEKNIHYDVKNIKGNLIKNEKKSNKIKSIEYIKNSQIKHYVYILRNEQLKSSFDKIYPLIKKDLNKENIVCSLSGISIEGLCKLYDICSELGPLNRIDYDKVKKLFTSDKFVSVNEIKKQLLENSLN